MPNNPFEKQLRKEEALYSKQIVYVINKALSNKKTIASAQPDAKQDDKQTPNVTKAVYSSAAHKAIAKIQKKYPSMQIHVDLKYKKIQRRWRAISNVTATYNMKKVGGKLHKVKPKETLWSISKENYGSGFFWTVLEDYNAHLKTKGKYLRAGVKVHVPQIEVIEKICVPATVKGSGSGPKRARKPAVDISYPNVVLEFSKEQTVEEIIPSPVATMKLAISISGALSVTKPGVIPLDFDVRKHIASISLASKHFTSSFSISDFKPASFSVSNKASGNQWKTSFKIKMNGTISLTISPQIIKFSHAELDYAGKISVTLEITYIPHYSLKKRSHWKKYGDWISDHQTEIIIGFIALPFATAAISATAAGAAGAATIKYPVAVTAALLTN